MENISADTSFLEMLDILNNNLIHEGKEPVAFDHDCREGICGMCSLHIDGQAHGPSQGATTCQIYMRKFKDGATITIEPWRSAAFPVIKDLVVNRSAYDQILQAGGFISVRTNSGARRQRHSDLGSMSIPTLSFLATFPRWRSHYRKLEMKPAPIFAKLEPKT